VFSVHWIGGVWGHLTVGLFSENPVPLMTTSGRSGLLMGGGWYFFTVQCISSMSLSLLGLLGSYPIIWIVNKVIPLRLDPASELVGCDLAEHDIEPPVDKVDRQTNLTKIENNFL
jgi:ammonium transporter, Amt family